MGARKEKPVSLGRHRRQCSICRHKLRFDIEQAFISWVSVSTIARDYALPDRNSVYRHARVYGLFPKRQENLKSALERIIEQGSDVQASASAIVGAIEVYAKINTRGQWIEPEERLSQRSLFESMTREELEFYARDGSLPRWFTMPAKQEGFDDA